MSRLRTWENEGILPASWKSASKFCLHWEEMDEREKSLKIKNIAWKPDKIFAEGAD